MKTEEVQYSASSYLKFSLGLVQILQPKYRIELRGSQRFLTISKTLGDPSTIPLVGTRTQIKYGKGLPWLARKTFDLGDIELSGSFGTETLRRVAGVGKLKDRIDGINEKSVSQTSQSEKLKWFEVDSTMSELSVVFPSLPPYLTYVLSQNESRFLDGLCEWKVKSGAYVSRGDVIAEFKVIPITDKSTHQKGAQIQARIHASEDGIITIRNHSWKEWPDFRTFTSDNREENILQGGENIWYSINIANSRLNYETPKLYSAGFRDLLYYLYFLPMERVANASYDHFIKLLEEDPNREFSDVEKFTFYLEALSDYYPTRMLTKQVIE